MENPVSSLEILQLNKVEQIPDQQELYVWINGDVRLLIPCDSWTGLSRGIVCAFPSDVAPTGVTIPGSVIGQEGDRFDADAFNAPNILLAARRKYDLDYETGTAKPEDVVNMSMAEVLLELLSGLNHWPVPWFLKPELDPGSYAQAMEIIKASGL